MTEPREQIDESSVHSDKSPPDLAETIRVGMQVAAQMNREHAAAMLEEGRKQARLHGVVPLFVEVYAEGWAAAMARAFTVVEEAQRAADKSLWDANFNADLFYKGRIGQLERQRDQVLAYVAGLPCSNCDHVHNDGEGRCGTPIPGYGRPCGCTWGPNDITKDIRDLLAKEKPE